MRALLLTLLVLGGGRMADAFKASEFKKCSDAAFCQRNRQNASGRRYQLLTDSLAVSGTEVTALLRNTVAEQNFDLRVSSVSGPAVRFEVTEAASARYRVQDVLLKDPPDTGPAWRIHSTAANLRLCFEDGTCLVLHFDPFRLVADRGGQELLQINGDGLLHVEHLRPKVENSTESGEWEERFRAFTDSKPNGPQALSLDVTYSGCAHLFGIPEHATRLSLPATIDKREPVSEPYRLYNLDVFEYELHSPFSLYGSVPFLLGQRGKESVGAFWLNAAEMFVDVWKEEGGMHSQWIAESGVLDVFLMMGPLTKDVLQQYGALTGTTALPQYCTLGYHQCRWNYRDEADVRNVDANFDHYGIPYDVLWLDIEHTDQKKYMTWDAKAFPDAVKMQEDLAFKGRKMVTIIDPHLKTDERYAVYTEAKKKGYFVKNTDGTDFVGHCWPGSSSYPDMTRPEVRQWWASQLQPDTYAGSTLHLYVWNDMNEPSVFNGPEITMQKDLLHSGTVEHRDVHNLYGYLYHWATTEGLILRGKRAYGSDGDRPFVLSRAYFAGTQRLGPIWTGDNSADWESLKVSIPMLLSNNLVGMAFCGADVAGFFGNPDAELFTRWYQTAVFYPFFRGHAHIETKRREPWLYGEETTARIKRALRERYALLPYIYTVFRGNNLTGEPIMRPMWYEFVEEEEVFEMEEQFMFGPSLMIRPILEAGMTEVDTYFPPGIPWYDAWTGEKIQTTAAQTNKKIPVTMEQIPFYYRGGSIVVRKDRPRRSTAAMQRDPVTLIVALDAEGHAEGEIYMDDGQSFAFLRSQFLHRQFKFHHDRLTSVNLNKTSREVRYTAAIEIEKIVLLGFTSEPETIVETSSMTRIHASWGPVRLERGAPRTGLVLKRPKVSIDQDWTILLTSPEQ